MRSNSYFFVIIFFISLLLHPSGFSANTHHYPYDSANQNNNSLGATELAELHSKSDLGAKFKRDFSNFALSELTALGNELNKSFHGSSIKNYFKTHYASMVNTYAQTMVNKQINDAIKQFGSGQASVLLNKDFKINQADVDLMVPIIKRDGLVSIFTQIGVQQGYGKQQATLGFGGREYSELPDFPIDVYLFNHMLGYNLFFDYDLESKHIRWSLGVELAVNLLKASANLYSPFTDFKKPKNVTTNDYLERPASGFDVNLEGRLPYKMFFTRFSYFQWSGDGYGVDPYKLNKTFTKAEIANLDTHVSGLDFSLGFSPFSLLSTSLSYTKANHYEEFQTKLFLTLKTEVPLSVQLKTITDDNEMTLKSLGGNLVERNKRMVLAYKLNKDEIKLKWVDADADSGTVYYSPTTSAIPIDEKLTRKATVTATTFPSGYTVQPIIYELKSANPTDCVKVNTSSAEVTVLNLGDAYINAIYAEDLYYKKSVITYHLIILEGNDVSLPTCIYQPADPSAPTVNCDPHAPTVDGGFKLFKGIDYTLSAASNSGNTSAIEFKLPTPSSSLTLNTDGTGQTQDVSTADALYNVSQDHDTTSGIGGYTSPDYPLQVVKDKMVLVWDDTTVASTGKVSINYVPGLTVTYTAREDVAQTNIKKPLVQPAVIDYAITSSIPANIATINSSTGTLTITNVGVVSVSAIFQESEFYISNDPIHYELTIELGSPELVWEDTILPGTTTPVNPAPKLTASIGDNFNVQASSASSGTITYDSSDTTVATINSTTGNIVTLTQGTITITASQATALPFSAATIDFILEVLQENDVSIPTCTFQPADPSAPYIVCSPHIPSATGGFELFKGIDYTLSAISGSVNTSPVQFELPSPASSLTLNLDGTGHTQDVTTSDVMYIVTQAQDPVSGIGAYTSPNYPLQVVKDKMVLKWDDPTLDATGKASVTYSPGITVTYTATESINDTNIKKPLVQSAVITYAINNTTPSGIASVNSTTGMVSINSNGIIEISATFEESEFYASNDLFKYELTINPGSSNLVWEDTLLPGSTTPVNPAPKLTASIGDSFIVEATSSSTGTITYSSSSPSIAAIDKDTGQLNALAPGQTDIEASQAAAPPYGADTIDFILTVLQPNSVSTPTCTFQPADSSAPQNTCDPYTPNVIGGFKLFKGIDYTLFAVSTSGNSSPVEFNLPVSSSVLSLNLDGTGHTSDITISDVIYVTTQAQDPINGYGAYTSPDYPLQVVKDKMILKWDDPILDSTGKASVTFVPSASVHYKATASEAIDKTKIKKPLVLAAVITYAVDNSTPPNIATIDRVTGEVTADDVGIINISATFQESAFYIGSDSIKYELTVNLAHTDLVWKDTVLPGSTTPVNPAPKLTASIGDSFIVEATSSSTGTITYSSSNLSIATIDQDTGVIDALVPGETTIEASQVAAAPYSAAKINFILKVLNEGKVSIPNCIFETADSKATKVTCAPHDPNKDGSFKLFKGIDYTLSATSSTANTSAIEFKLPLSTSLLTLNIDGTGHTKDITTTDVIYIVTQVQDTTNNIGAYTSPDYQLQIVKDKMVLEWNDATLNATGKASITYSPGITATYTAIESINDTNIKKTLAKPAVINYAMENATPSGIATINSTTGEVSINDSGTVIVSATFKESEFYIENDLLQYELTIVPGNTNLVWQDVTLPGSTTPVNPAPKLKVRIGNNFTVQATSNSTGAITYSSDKPNIATIDKDTGNINSLALGQTTIIASQAAAAPYTAATTSFILDVYTNNVVELPTCTFQPFDPTAPRGVCEQSPDNKSGGDFILFKGVDYEITTKSNTNTNPFKYTLKSSSTKLTLNSDGTGHANEVQSTDVLYVITQDKDTVNDSDPYTSPDYSLKVKKDYMVIEWDTPSLNVGNHRIDVSYSPGLTMTHTATAHPEKTNILKMITPPTVTYRISLIYPDNIATIDPATGEVTINDSGELFIAADTDETEFYKYSEAVYEIRIY